MASILSINEIFGGVLNLTPTFTEPVKTTIVSGDNININALSNISKPTANINLRNIAVDGEIVTIKVSDIEQIGNITLYGDYPQNSVDLPKFDLSKVISLHPNIAKFNFILSLRDGDQTPKVFANKDVMIDLIAKYGKNEPIPVNYLINERKLVVVDIEPIKKLIQQMREAELSINLNRNDANGQVEVSKHLFSYSNYGTATVGGMLAANPTYDLKELVKYISWVVSKPTPKYDERLIPANELGEWDGYTNVETDVDEPSTETTNTPPIIPLQYPPVGRAGIDDSETVFRNGKLYVWNSILNEWSEDNGSGDIDVSINGGSLTVINGGTNITSVNTINLSGGTLTDNGGSYSV